jgi:oligosaccharide repeat unit polymerase
MFFVAYFIPTIILPEIISDFNHDIIELYEGILLLGAAFYLLGMVFGYFSQMTSKKNRFSWANMPEDVYCKRVSGLTTRLTKIAIVGMIICFLVMGFVPMFASNPLAAKFFRNEYQAPYARVSVLFRTCNYILQFTIPLLLVLWFYYRKKIYLFLFVISSVILIFCFARGPALSGTVLAIGLIVAAKKKQMFKHYLIFLILIYSIGSAAYSLLGMMIGKEFFTYDTIWETISYGAPDIQDQLLFLTAFTNHPEYTYGRTFWGGLIPSHYYWNPSVWTLKIINNGADINNIISGGLRLPLPMWGYVSFSWIGVVVMSLSVGFLTGTFVKKTQWLLYNSNNLVIQAIIILLYGIIFSFFINFYVMSMYSLPIIFILFFYLYRLKL